MLVILCKSFFCDSGPSCVDAKGDIVQMLHIHYFSHLLGPKPSLNVKCIFKTQQQHHQRIISHISSHLP